MFKKLINEALISVSIHVDSPLMISSGQPNALDPSLPNAQVIRQSKNGIMQEIIPGSSLKGVFRSRAEQLLKGQEYPIDNPFDRTTTSNTAKGNGSNRYQKSCPVSKLFGSLSLKSRIHFTDAYPISPEQVITGVRNGVGIDRITGGAAGKALFDVEVIESGVFASRIKLQNYELWQLSLILWLLRDLDQGYMRLGASTSRGFGQVRVNDLNVAVRTYRKLDKTEYPITGYELEDRTKKNIMWKKELFGAVYEQETLDSWIGEDGILQDIKGIEETGG